jgi:hypothetical protein
MSSYKKLEKCGKLASYLSFADSADKGQVGWHGGPPGLLLVAYVNNTSLFRIRSSIRLSRRQNFQSHLESSTLHPANTHIPKDACYLELWASLSIVFLFVQALVERMPQADIVATPLMGFVMLQ